MRVRDCIFSPDTVIVSSSQLPHHVTVHTMSLWADLSIAHHHVTVHTMSLWADLSIEGVVWVPGTLFVPGKHVPLPHHLCFPAVPWAASNWCVGSMGRYPIRVSGRVNG